MIALRSETFFDSGAESALDFFSDALHADFKTRRYGTKVLRVCFIFLCDPRKKKKPPKIIVPRRVLIVDVELDYTVMKGMSRRDRVKYLIKALLNTIESDLFAMDSEEFE